MTIQEFAAQPWLVHLVDKPCWTVTCMDKGSAVYKMPINLPHLMKTGKLRGDTVVDGTYPYMALSDMLKDATLRQLTSVTLILNQHGWKEDFVILDIEPGCPEEKKKELLSLPWFYGETSMSGKGYHLLFPSPATYPEILETKPSVKEDKSFEILLGRNHAVTFTMRPIRRTNGIIRPLSDFYDIWEKIASQKKITETRALNTENLPDIHTIEDGDLILSMIESAGEYKKSIEDFTGDDREPDISRWEFGLIGFYKFHLAKTIARAVMLQKAHEGMFPGKKAHIYTEEEQLALLYHIVKKHIPYREKHDEIRFGKSFLLWSCERCLTMKTVETEKKGDG